MQFASSHHELDGPSSRIELSMVPGGLTPTWASSMTPLERDRPAADVRRGRIASPVAPDAQAPPQTHKTRERGQQVVLGPWVPGGTERRLGRDVARRGKLSRPRTYHRYAVGAAKTVKQYRPVA